MSIFDYLPKLAVFSDTSHKLIIIKKGLIKASLSGEAKTEKRKSKKKRERKKETKKRKKESTKERKRRKREKKREKRKIMSIGEKFPGGENVIREYFPSTDRAL